MSLPFFFVHELNDQKLTLDEESSRHVITVLRKGNGDAILLTDGHGKKANAIITDDNRKKTVVEISSLQNDPPLPKKTAIGISLIKNASRFEWFLEKVTEIGIGEIFPLICERTEKEKFRKDRLQHILVSAMLQSQRTWLPLLHEPVSFKNAMDLSFDQKFIAHCLPGHKLNLQDALRSTASSLLLIGPEGDFTNGEIELALNHQMTAVSLGSTRLRTETAGMVGAVLLVLD